MSIRPLFLLLLLVGIAACQPDPLLTADRPRLIGERDLDSDEAAALPTLFVLPSVTPVIVPTSAPATVTQAVISTEVVVDPIVTAEQQEAVMMVTPTLQPSKTPTVTPTQTLIPTITTTPTTTVTASPTPTDDQFTLPTNAPAAQSQATSVAANAPSGNIDFNPPPPSNSSDVAAQCTANPWWFREGLYAPPVCPQEQPITGHGVFQRFENGYMLWLENNDKIYVLYQTAEQPRWQIFDDPYVEGDPELDFSWIAREQQPPQSYQPRRGFGELWRGREDVRFRIGWAIQEWETIYTPRFQRGEDGSMTIEHPAGGVFFLAARGSDWFLYLDR
jgi:hypothetical protein